MGKYYGIGGIKIGKIGNEKYYLNKNTNIVQEKGKYVPVNNAWLKKEDFKEYILSLLQEGIPQIYVLNELPEDLYPYALIFVQNQNATSIYVDKEGVRTQINIGDDEYDAVDVTNAIPSQPRNNTIYFVNQPARKNRNSTEYDLYVCENNELKQIVLKGEDDPDLPHIKEVVGDVTTKSLKNVYNRTLAANKNVITDNNGFLTTGNIPHLYMHWIHFDKGGTGEVCIIIYSTFSGTYTGNTVGYYLYDLGCTTSWKLFPATGCNPNGYPIQGIYGYYEQEGMIITVGFYTVSINGTEQIINDFSDYSGSKQEKVVQLF